jgi:hypothetical protein
MSPRPSPFSGGARSSAAISRRRRESREREASPILSHPFWQRYFAADRSILDKSITIDGKRFDVVGVMPEDFDFLPADVDLFVPDNWEDRSSDRERGMLVMGRLKKGRTPEEAEAEISLISSQLAAEHPEENEGYRSLTMPLRDYFPGRTDTLLMYILLTVSGFVLLIACANIANLLLARAEVRQGKGGRTARAGRGESAALLTESVLLARRGALGTAFRYSVRVRQSMPTQLPLVSRDGSDRPSLYLATSMLAGMIFRIAPAPYLRRRPARALEEIRGNGHGKAQRLGTRSWSPRSEPRVLIGSGALMNIFREFIMPTRVSGGGYPAANSPLRGPSSGTETSALTRGCRRLSEIPGVTGVAAMNGLPRTFVGHDEFTSKAARPPSQRGPVSGWQAVVALTSRRLSPISGRGVTEEDREDAEAVAVVSENFVEVLPDEDQHRKARC